MYGKNNNSTLVNRSNIRIIHTHETTADLSIHFYRLFRHQLVLLGLFNGSHYRKRALQYGQYQPILYSIFRQRHYGNHAIGSSLQIGPAQPKAAFTARQRQPHPRVHCRHLVNWTTHATITQSNYSSKYVVMDHNFDRHRVDNFSNPKGKCQIWATRKK